MYSKAKPIASKLIINRIEFQKQALDKIPALYNALGVFDKRSLEQCTSEDVASFKSGLINGNNLLVLGGGLGIDEQAFSRRFKEITSIELNNELNDITNFNFNRLQITNINRISSDAENFISQNSKMYDWIYSDPDRRDEKGKQIKLSEHNPNIVALLPDLFKFSARIAIKTSPLYDFEMALKELNYVSDLYAISRAGEMKELLIIMDNQKTDLSQISIHCIDIDKTTNHAFSINITENVNPVKSALNDDYFFEAGSSLIKMRRHHHYAAKMGWRYIDKQVPFYTSNELTKDILGKAFKHIHHFEFSRKSLIQYLKDQGIKSYHLKARGLNFNTQELSQSLRQQEGGEDFIFILPFNNQKIAFHCRKA